jgi:hypothetical protein
MFFARLSGVPDPAARIGTALAAMDFTGHGQERMPTFSKGTRQRAGLAQAIVNEPAVLFLDEPTSGLDPPRGGATAADHHRPQPGPGNDGFHEHPSAGRGDQDLHQHRDPQPAG